MLERICQLRVALITFPMSSPALFPLFIAERLVLADAADADTPDEQPDAEDGRQQRGLCDCAVCLCENEESDKLRDRELTLGLGFKSTKELPIHFFSALRLQLILLVICCET